MGRSVPLRHPEGCIRRSRPLKSCIVRTGEADSIAVLFSALTCVPVSGEIGRKAGEYLRKYPHSHSVELGDAPIAVTASVHDVPLWNRNKKRYPMKDVRRF